jgi:hypothetical protein
MSDMTWSKELVTTPVMTLREHYAGLAMQGLLSDGGYYTDPTEGARLAIAHADALIAELQREAGDE